MGDAMDRIRIVGGRKLHGTIAMSGAKNAALPLMIAALLTEETLILDDELAFQMSRGRRWNPLLTQPAAISKAELNVARTHQVLGIGAFIEPTIDRSDQISRLGKPLLRSPNPGQGGGCSQFQ